MSHFSLKGNYQNPKDDLAKILAKLQEKGIVIKEETNSPDEPYYFKSFETGQPELILK
jgi:hypothetical protein